jgi:predicted nucleic acid-binding protein
LIRPGAQQQPVVLDASFVVPWFKPEAITPVSERLLASSRPLLAPRFLLMEVISALLTNTRRGQLPVGRAEAALRVLESLAAAAVPPRLRLSDDGELLRKAVRLAERLRHPLYDCPYLVLVLDEGAALATFDKRLAEHARSLSIPLWAPEDAG